MGGCGVGAALLASVGGFLQGGCRRGIGWVEGFERELRQRDIDGSPKNGWGRRLISQRLGFFVLFPILFGVAEVSLQRFAGEILTAQAESDGQAQHGGTEKN